MSFVLPICPFDHYEASPFSVSNVKSGHLSKGAGLMFLLLGHAGPSTENAYTGSFFLEDSLGSPDDYFPSPLSNRDSWSLQKADVLQREGALHRHP